MTSPPEVSSDLSNPQDLSANGNQGSGKVVRAVAIVSAALVLLTWGANVLLVGNPVRSALASDFRNSGFSIRAHYAYYVNPSILVLDLRRADEAAPRDLFRGLFQAAEALHVSGRTFTLVILSRSGAPIYHLDGQAFEEAGRSFSAGENPLYLLRTLPEQLRLPNGEPAYGTWTGGLIAVAGKQMEDANDFAQTWALGR